MSIHPPKQEKGRASFLYPPIYLSMYPCITTPWIGFPITTPFSSPLHTGQQASNQGSCQAIIRYSTTKSQHPYQVCIYVSMYLYMYP